MLSRLSAYDLQPTTVRLTSDEWNSTYRVTDGAGEQYLLRLHRPAVTSTESVRVELDWLTALARDTALLLPRVVLRRDARPAAIVSAAGIQRVCVVFRWIGGRFLEAGLRPPKGMTSRPRSRGHAAEVSLFGTPAEL